MAIRTVTDRNGDDWDVRSDGFYQRGHRVLKAETVVRELGPVTDKPTHRDHNVLSFDDELRQVRGALKEGRTDEERLAAVRHLAFEIERDPNKILVQDIPAAIRRALGDA